MKRSDLVELISAIISNNGPGDSISTANLILKQLDSLNLLNPTHKVTVIRRDIEAMPYEEEVLVSGWRNE